MSYLESLIELELSALFMLVRVISRVSRSDSNLRIWNHRAIWAREARICMGKNTRAAFPC
jgi:hypothetical protein